MKPEPVTLLTTDADHARTNQNAKHAQPAVSAGKKRAINLLRLIGHISSLYANEPFDFSH